MPSAAYSDRAPGSTVGFRRALTAPGAPPLVAWSLVGRLAFAMTNLSLLLYVRAVTGSFAIAGAMTAVSLVGTATTSIVQGRWIDRSGPTRPLLWLTTLYVPASGALVLLVPADVPLSLLAPVVLIQSLTQPSLAGPSRAMWPRLVSHGPVRTAAYTYEAVSFETCYLCAPALAGTLGTLLWPGTALVSACTMITISAVGFALSPAARRHQGGTSSLSPSSRSTFGVQRRGVGVLLTAGTAFGIGVGCMAVAVPAATTAHGVPELAGVLLTAWSLCSVLGGLSYAKNPRPRALPLRLPVLTMAFGLLLFLPAASGSLLALTVVVVLSGLTLAPQVTAQSLLLDVLVPPHRLAEAYGWLTTVIAVGNAAGQAMGGSLAEEYGTQILFLVGALIVCGLGLVVGACRSSLNPTYLTS